VPVCHNCGKEIEIGKRYCEQCGPAGEERVKRLLEMSDQTKYKGPARGYNRMLLISIWISRLNAPVLTTTIRSSPAIPK